MPDDSSLPIHAVLPQLKAALAGGPNAVLVAPPGAGKTTAVAAALLREDWCTGEILLLSPRRVAARAAAERMANVKTVRARAAGRAPENAKQSPARIRTQPSTGSTK